MDEDIMNHIKDYNEKYATNMTREVAGFMAKGTELIASQVGAGYNVSDEVGTSLMSSILTAIILTSSKDIDQSLQRLDAIYQYTKKGLIQLDKEINTKG
jgi:hypothetical protein